MKLVLPLDKERQPIGAVWGSKASVEGLAQRLTADLGRIKSTKIGPDGEAARPSPVHLHLDNAACQVASMTNA
ncbi:MAG: hypothetical protein AAGC92_03440 [Pseudomonadota bacterium]